MKSIKRASVVIDNIKDNNSKGKFNLSIRFLRYSTFQSAFFGQRGKTSPTSFLNLR